MGRVYGYTTNQDRGYRKRKKDGKVSWTPDLGVPIASPDGNAWRALGYTSLGLRRTEIWTRNTGLGFLGPQVVLKPIISVLEV